MIQGDRIDGEQVNSGMPIHSADQLRPIFIGGAGRSGTTILFNMLRHHPQVAALSKELRILVDPGGALYLVSALSDEWSPYRADEAIGRFERLLREVGSTSRWKQLTSVCLRRMGIAPARYAQLGHGKEFGMSYYRQRCHKLVESLVRPVSAA